MSAVETSRSQIKDDQVRHDVDTCQDGLERSRSRNLIGFLLAKAKTLPWSVPKKRAPNLKWTAVTKVPKFFMVL